MSNRKEPHLFTEQGSGTRHKNILVQPLDGYSWTFETLPLWRDS